MIRASLAVLAASLAFVTGCEGRPRAEASKDLSSAGKIRSGGAVAVLDLGAGAPEEDTPSLLIGRSRRSFDELVRAIGETSKDKHVKAVLVKLGGVALGIARAEELGAALADVAKSGKPVHCHADGYSNATLLAAARGCTKLWASPAGEVEAVGIAFQMVYLRKLLADELKVTIDVQQVGKFKGAEEPYTRDGPSDEARASLEGVLADIRAAWLDGVREGRKTPRAAEAAEDGPYSPARAKELGLVDAVGYADEVLEELQKTTGAGREETRFGPGAQDRPDDLGDIVRVLAGGGAGAPVALIRAVGSISMDGGGGLFGGRGGITERALSKTLARVEKDDDVKAVVLRIDSPGGSALASDLLWHRLMRLRKKKPLVVSVGGMAASGGYYLASTGSFIYADATSIVGSIGVVGVKLAFGTALERFGVHAETFTGKGRDPGAATRAAYMSPLVPWDEATRTRVRETMTGIYDLFLARVAEGRSAEGRTMGVAEVAPSAEGRLFSGREGKVRGLVDEIGGLREAVARAKQLAKLPDDADLRVYGGKPGLLDALEQGDDPDERAKALDAARPKPLDALVEAAPDVAPFAEGILPLVEGEHAVTAVPFAITAR